MFLTELETYRIVYIILSRYSFEGLTTVVFISLLTSILCASSSYSMHFEALDVAFKSSIFKVIFDILRKTHYLVVPIT